MTYIVGIMTCTDDKETYTGYHNDLHQCIVT